MEYKIIITKDRKQYRYLKTYRNRSNAINYYKNLIHENSKVKFEKVFINYARSTFHIELLSPIKYFDIIEWEKDEMGRNIESPNRNGWYIWRLKPWKEPEYFTIWGLPDKYDYDFLHNLLKNTKETIGMSTIQNKLILDIDGKPIIIMLKNIPDAIRLYNVILSDNLGHVLPFGIMSKSNRKEFYKSIKSLGIPVKMFYTKSTRW